MRKSEAYVGAFIAAFGLMVALLSRHIPPQPGQVLSAAIPPFMIGLALVVLGLAYALQARRAAGIPFPIAVQDFGWLLAILAATGAYVWLFGALGHLAATVLAAPPLFFVLGCRGWIATGVVPVIVAVSLHLLFFWVMGLYDAPGWLVDLRIF